MSQAIIAGLAPPVDEMDHRSRGQLALRDGRRLRGTRRAFLPLLSPSCLPLAIPFPSVQLEQKLHNMKNYKEEQGSRSGVPRPSSEDVSVSFCFLLPAQLFLEPSEYGAEYDDSELLGKILLEDD